MNRILTIIAALFLLVPTIATAQETPVLARTSASGATPYTSDAALAAKTYAGYTIHRQIAADNGFGTFYCDSQIVLTEAMLQSPFQLDWSKATPPCTEPTSATHSQFYERERIEAQTPIGLLKTSAWSNVLQKTDGVAPVVLNSADKTSGVTLTNGALTFNEASSGPNTVRASRGASLGKVYWEAKPTNATGTLRIGLADSSATLTAWWSDGIHDAVYDKNGPLTYNGASNNYATYVTNDVIGFALDATAKKLWVSKNNVWQNGDPVAGTGGQALASISTPILPAVEGEFGNIVDFHFATGSFTYTPPTGYAAMWLAPWALPRRRRRKDRRRQPLSRRRLARAA